MIPKAREVRLKPKVRKVLEARCRAPTTAQRDVKRARIVLLAAEGRSTRSIAAEVVVQPRIVSNWRHRVAEHGLGGLKDRPRAGKKPIYGKATNKRILALLDKSPPAGYARWTGPLLAKALGDVDVQYVWRFLREHSIDLSARKSWCESNDPKFMAKAADVVGLYIDPPVAAVGPTKLLQGLHESRHPGAPFQVVWGKGHENADAMHPARLLRPPQPATPQPRHR